ncbi:hypothetical protein AVEN_21519-1 [Araneus ventricosus]|uniref:Uncharacterized protein n=1 Tax=Araneus ventricosus TaxID=182803 RepID=A0A4Y2P3T3_ARAVE|nr:hypothetical protein AVEN_21519-1 [Araneus ventricosus]
MSVGGTEHGFKTPNIPEMFIYVEVGGLKRKEQMFNFIVIRFQPFSNTPNNVDWRVVILKELPFSREDSLDKRIEFIGTECSDTDRLLSTHARENMDQEDALRSRSPDHKGTTAVLHSSQQNWKEGILGECLLSRFAGPTEQLLLIVLAALEPSDLVIAREAAFTKVRYFRVSPHCFGGSWESLYEVPPRSLLHPAHNSIPISLKK